MTVMTAALAEGVYQIETSRIWIPEKRWRSSSDVSSMRDSLRRVGQLQPIVVLVDGSLVAGKHRLLSFRAEEADARARGEDPSRWTVILATVRDMDPTQAELSEIDENLMQHSLTVQERGEHLARREELLRQLGLRAEPGDNRSTMAARSAEMASGASDAPLDGDAGSADIPAVMTTKAMAAQIGIAERTAQRDMQLVRAIPQDVRDEIRATGIANKPAELLALGRLEEEEQTKVAQLLGEGKASSVLQAQRILHPELKEANEAHTAEAVKHIKIPTITVIIEVDGPNPKTRMRGDKVADREAIGREFAIEGKYTQSDRADLEGLKRALSETAGRAFHDPEIQRAWLAVPKSSVDNSPVMGDPQEGSEGDDDFG